MDDYQKFRFSITCQTDDDAILHCLRALCQWAEQHPKPQIGWGGTTLSSWKHSGGELKLRFTDPRYRSTFKQKAEQLLNNRWKILDSSDNDPASRQRAPH